MVLTSFPIPKTGMPMLILTQSVAFVLYNLCRYPEYVQPLREEIEAVGQVATDNQNHEMPYLDSFLKETARLNPLTDSKS